MQDFLCDEIINVKQDTDVEGCYLWSRGAKGGDRFT